MRSLSPLAASLAAVLALAGCSGTVESPVGPSGSAGTSFTPPPSPAPQPGPPEIAGTIAVRSIAPEPGTTLLVRNCSWAGPNFPYLCADQLQLALDVHVDQDVPRGVLSAQFVAGGSECGSAGQPVALTAGTQTIRLNGAEISSDGALFRCPLPAETTQMIVRLTAEGRVLLTREFAYTYRFVLE
jgi:hypothetical protein